MPRYAAPGASARTRLGDFGKVHHDWREREDDDIVAGQHRQHGRQHEVGEKLRGQKGGITSSERHSRTVCVEQQHGRNAQQDCRRIAARIQPDLTSAGSRIS